MPTLNRPSLAKAVQSVIDQTCTNWELLILGNDSQGVYPSDPRIHYYIHNALDDPQKLNTLTEMAKGGVLNFAADDDVITPRALEQVAKLMNKEWLVGRIKIMPADLLYGRPCTYNELLERNRIPCPAVYWTREAANRAGKWSNTIASDYDYWIKIWKAAGPPQFIPAILSLYNEHEGQMSSIYKKEVEEDAAIIRQRYTDMV